MSQIFTKKYLLPCVVLFCYIGFAQEFNSFEVRYQSNIKGDLTFIANNIVNRDGGSGSTEPEDPYNATGSSSQYNDYLNQQYIDIDSDPSTFSSSRANFTYPQASCNLIRYAGLYWSATYPSEQAGQALGTNRQNDFNQVKFKVPGGAYVDVVADEVLFDGFTSTDNSVTQNSPYACYADVTSLLTPLADAQGDYTIANVRSVVGSLSPGGGASAGWTLVVVYENPTFSGKLITTFDGFARVRSENPTVDINYIGFNTIPVGPVRAKIGAAALEGDNRITGDRLRIRAASVAGFTILSNAVNPAANFFNSNITLDGAITTNRTPNSVNTLGYDTDIFLLNNPLNSVIPNNETAATLRFTSDGDQYYPFFNSFNVEIIEPSIVVEKRVEDIAGNDITGLGVNLGQLLDYVLSFQNIGNDDGTNYTIRDVLPANVTFIPGNLVLPPGVTYVYDPASHEITFSIPQNLIEQGDPVSSIRLRVRVAENCFDFVDACTDLIENLAYSTYRGVLNDNQITDDPSVSDFDFCGFATPGATNFLLDDLDDCDFSRTVQLCGDNVLLDAGNGFDSYTWYRDENGDSLIDAGDTIITDGDPDNDPSTLLVNDVGIYIVDKVVADPCKGFQEIITVERFGTTQTNPIIDLINDTTNTVEGEVVTCSDDGELLPKIFLCGLNDTELIQINIPDAQSILWQQLDEASCAASSADCANLNTGCTWNNIAAGNNFLAENAGQYRLIINYQNGCFSRFYFNIFKNPLNPQYNSTDLICASPGNITVTNMPADYDYQLLDATNGNILVPFSAGNGPSFTIAGNGAYTVEMRQQGVTDGCIFRLEDIGILSRNFQVDVTTKNTDCIGLGEIAISILNVGPQYYYEISQGGTTVDTFGPSVDNNYTFLNLNPGVYDILATTDDGCTYTEQVTILDDSDLDLSARVSQHISCKEGNILMESSGGKTPHTYAIWTYVDEGGTTITSYPTPNDIPSSEFQTSQIFDILDPGDYTFVVVDRNNCFSFSNTVNITLVPAISYDPSTVIDESCFGASEGSISFNITNANGFQLTFYLIDYTGAEIASNASGVFSGLAQGDYTVRLNQRKGGASCDFFEDYTIAGPTNGLTADAVLIQDYTCSQLGIIEAQNVAGGTAPYEYSIDGVNFVSGAGAGTFSNLTDGSYSITIRDANGCTLLTNPVTIDPLNEPSDLTFVASVPNCPALTSDITVTVIDGNSPFLFEIIAPTAVPATSTSGNSANFDALAPDTYTFRVTDANGCAYDENFTITPVVPIAVAGTLVSNTSCFAGTDGAVDFTVSGFSTTYSYSINGAPAITAQAAPVVNLTALAAGDYTIVVTDETTNCSATDTITVSQPAAALDFTFAVTPLTCAADASVTITATNGWGGYSYQVEQPDLSILGPQASNVFSGLNQIGTYTISVTDTGGCTVNKTFDIVTPINPVASIDATSDLCYASTNLATVVVGASGGQAPYYYSINGGPTRTSNTFTDLIPGNYSFTVIDSNGCSDTLNQSIEPELTGNAVLSKDQDCSVSPNGVIDLTVNGGYAPFTYALDFNGGGYVVFGGSFPYAAPGPGTYQVRITDSQGCIGESNIITVTPSVTPSATATANNPTCNGDTNGIVEINVDPNLGIAPYQIDFNGMGYSTQTVYSGLAAGTYNYTVMDSKNCTFSDSVTLTEPDAITLSATANPITCGAMGNIPGSIDITGVAGGTGNYTYYLLDSGGVLATTTTTNPTGPTALTGVNFGDLSFGNYYVRVIDDAGCEYNFGPVQVASDVNDLSITADSSGSCATGVSYDISIVNGVGPFEIRIYDGTTFNPGDGVTPNGLPITSGTANERNHRFTALDFDISYVFEALDTSTGCTYIRQFPAEPSPSPITLSETLTDIVCNGDNNGQIDFTVDNYDAAVTNIDYEILEQLANTLVRSGTITGPAGGPVLGSETNLPAGDYILTATEVGGTLCSAAITFRITEPTPIAMQLVDQNNANCNEDAQVTVLASGATGPYTYAFVPDGAAPAPGDFTASNYAELDPSINVNWDVYARDANGCTTSLDVAIAVDPEPVISGVVGNQCAAPEGQFFIDVTLDTAGVGPYYISLNGGAYQAVTLTNAGDVYTIGNLNSGSYTISLLDVNSCGNSFTLDIFPPPSITAEVTTQPTCLGNDGELIITAYGGSGVFLYELFDGVVSVNGAPQASPVFIGLDSKTYTAYVYDQIATGCDAFVNITLEIPTAVLFTAATTDVSCNGGADGSITVTLDPTMNNPPYLYELYDSTGLILLAGPQTSRVFNNLSAADYMVLTRSARACFNTQAVTITEPPAVDVTATATDFACNPDNTVAQAVITALATDGTPPYAYSIDGVNFFASNTFSLNDTGVVQNITVTVRDDNGCTDTTPVTINPINMFTVSVNQTASISCINPETIQIAVADNGDPLNSYTFELLPVGNPNGVLTGTPTNTTATFDLSTVGSYTFRVTDTATGCFVTSATYDIAPYDLIDVVAIPTTSVTCFGDANGSLAIDVSGYSGAYSYEIYTGSGVSTGMTGTGNTSTNPLNISGLSGGNYYVRITETAAPECVEDSNVITILSPDMPLTAIVNPIANVTCTNDQGEILVDPNGGYAPYDIVLTNTITSQVYSANNVGVRVFAGLSAGNYTVVITDSNGCVLNDTETLIQPTPITADITATPASMVCYGDTNATVSAININGGQGTYQYQLNYYDTTGTAIEFVSGGQVSPVFNNLGAGVYSIIVSDGWNCDVETIQVTITEPSDVMGSLIQLTPLSCTNQAQTQITATGGTAPYEWSTNGTVFTPMSGGNTHVFTVPAGIYQYYVRDSFGCDAIISNQVSVEPVIPLAISLDTSAAFVNCTGEATATLVATASGGLGNYSYELFTDTALTTLIAGPQTSRVFNALFAGSYYIRVTSMDCVAVTSEIIIDEPVPLQIDQEQFTNVSCAEDNDGTIMVSVSGGTGNILYAISPNLNKFDSVNTFTELNAGVYDVIAQDENGCFITFQFTITQPTPVDVTYSALPEVCAGSEDGAIDVFISGGSPPYRTAFNSNNDADYVLNQTSFVDLAAGTYVIFVKDAQDCVTNIVVEIEPGVNLNAQVEPVYECTGDTPDNSLVITMEDPSIAGDVLYALDSTDPADMQLSADFRNIPPGNHYIAISHANGCLQTINFEIEAFEPLTLTLEQNNINEITAIAGGGMEPYTFYFNDENNGSNPIYYIRRTGNYTVTVVDGNGCEVSAQIYMEFIDVEIPNFFTPDGDGMNDYWKPENIAQFPRILIKIFDRYGREVARVAVNEQGWDGTYHGTELPTGDYWYIIKLQGESDDREFVGHFTLYR